MSDKIVFKEDSGLGFRDYEMIPMCDCAEIYMILMVFDDIFNPPLSKRLSDLNLYAKKLSKHAIVYVLKRGGALGFIAFYANNHRTNIAYLAQIAVQPAFMNNGVGTMLLDKCIEISKNNDMIALKLEVYKYNIAAIHFYQKKGFSFSGNASVDFVYMIKKI